MKLFLFKKFIRRPENKKGRSGVSYLRDDTAKLKIVYDRIEKVMEEKKPYLDGDFSIEDLSSLVCVSRSVTSKALSRIGKTNFRPYINGYRVRHSQQLIRDEPRMRFSEVARMSGFNSVPSFNTWFKIVTSTRPSEYLTEIWERPRLRFLPRKKE